MIILMGVFVILLSIQTNEKDGQLRELNLNLELVSNFGKHVASVIHSQSLVLVAHKTISSFLAWDIEKCMTAAGEELHSLGSVVFDRCLHAPYYQNRKARERKSFPCTDAVWHCFSKNKNLPIPFVVPVTNAVVKQIIAGTLVRDGDSSTSSS